MNLYTKSLLFVLVLLALVAPLFIKGPDGRPMMTLDDWLPDTGGLFEGGVELPSGGEMLKADTPGASIGQGKMYKWQDEQGRWHFSSEKPEGGVAVSVEELPDIENVMEAPVKESDNNSSISLPGGFSL